MQSYLKVFKAKSRKFTYIFLNYDRFYDRYRVFTYKKW